jgi:hypothetical protein
VLRFEPGALAILALGWKTLGNAASLGAATHHWIATNTAALRETCKLTSISITALDLYGCRWCIATLSLAFSHLYCPRYPKLPHKKDLEFSAPVGSPIAGLPTKNTLLSFYLQEAYLAHGFAALLY